MMHARYGCSRLVLTFGLLAAGRAAWGADSAAPSRPAVDFARDIRPILSNNCYKCHGFDDKQRQAGLRLDTREGAFAALASGARAVVPGDVAQSGLLSRIASTDPDQKMPPPATGKKLTAEQIDLIERWIASGAEWRGHWSFLPVEPAEPPAVAHETWPRNPIDRFVARRLEAEGLSPSPEADRATSIRRATLDLTGLPPTPEEVDAFLLDNSPDAYERLIDRLLASPRYGEHLARYWLDAARYGDTHGLHFDNERSLWPYRDWVIKAFNQNMPFDRFTIEQLAGDLLPDATLDQRVATGFNRCNVSTSEGGSIDEEVLVRYAVDRVETTSTVWLGLTTGCAVCHDHKFDPISQREFYRLFAFFNGVAEAAMDGNQLLPPPIVKAPTAEQQAQQQLLSQQVAQVDAQIVAELAKVAYVDPQPTATPVPTEPRDYTWIDDGLPAGARAEAGEWQFVGKPDHPVQSGEKSLRREGAGTAQYVFLDANPGLRIGEGDKFFGYVYLDPKNPPKAVMLQFNDGAWEHRAVWGEDVIPFGTTGTPGRQVMGPLPKAGEWVRLEVEAAKVGLNAGAVVRGWAFTQFDGVVYWDRGGIVSKAPQGLESFESQRAWEQFVRAYADPALPATVVEAVKVEPEARNDAQKREVRDYFLERACTSTRGTFDPLHRQAAAAKKALADLEAAAPATMVMADMQQPRETFMLIRGAYDKKGDQVDPGVPASLPPLPEGAPANRLGLARWLVDPKHPLTSRVIVNRFWQQFFGVGIVKTAEDFGAQGQWPVHPELLDWLASEFVRSGWNVKHVQRLIATSATYRQSSKATRQLLERDLANDLLARGPRFRLDAEVVRDGALFASGLLVEKLGGRSVRPYQPEGVWEAVAFLGSNTQIYKPDQGEGLYRRSMYTFWKRTAPPPALTTFDAPSRETCAVRRARTNTPLQALVSMNDKQYVEAARRMAERMMTAGGALPADRLAYGFRLATARAPSLDEVGVLVDTFMGHLAEYRANRDAAGQLLSFGDSPRNEALDVAELAAYCMTANVILNLDETLTKE